MRFITNDELVLVSGGVSMADGDGSQSSIIPSVWALIGSWFSGLSGGSSGSSGTGAVEPAIQSITISAPRWTEADEIKYQIEQGLANIPNSANCQFNYQINPSSSTISASVTASVTPSGTAGTSQTTQSATRTWNCKKP
ncbi:hypothetical protein [Undibacterium sp. Ji22W]|uniref:hypothetical protein n=1 Tax=Undibacterium sp. Ji22W TaxID=3413038 RepID=UPI003BEF6ED9